MIAWLFQFALIATMYGAYFLKIDGAQALMLFLAWVTSAVYFLSSFASVEELAKLPPKPLGKALRLFSVAVGLALMVLLAWHRQFITATVWFIALNCAITTGHKVAKIRSDKP